jgi:rhodanese-related sulfurtransferase
MANKNILTVIGATIAASLCCVTPVLAVLAGSSSLASSFSWLAPYHNYLAAFTVLVLIYAWYDKLKPSKDIECACDDENFFTGKTFLAIVTVFTIIMLTFPQWGSKVFQSAPTAESCSAGVCDSGVANEEEHKVAKNLPTLKIDTESSSCDTAGGCPTSQSQTTSQKVATANLPVLKYMNEEKLNPTPYKQVTCSGTGNKELDAMMANMRAEVQEMPPPVLLKMLDDDEDVILVDIREQKQKDGRTIPSMESYSMSYGQVYFSAVKNLQDRNNVVVVYGKFGMVSLFVASTLKKLGYNHVYSLKGGTDAWKLAGYPYEKIAEE